MKNLVEVIAKQLVDFPEEVSVSQREDEHAVILELKVAPSDMGKIIGKQGKIAKAIRTIVKSATASSSKKVVVEINE
ncbi:MAG: KH domain-containing protein [Candidatus Niameybacter stercoravium]|nr:KH domain-containing protein [Candidatus Niameybacter stercoravium]